MESKISFYSIACITVFLIAMFFFQEHRSVSDLENRSMVLFPDFSVNAFFDGQFQDVFEEAMKDQVFERDSIVKLNTSIIAKNREVYNLVHGQLNEWKALAFPEAEQRPVEIGQSPEHHDNKSDPNDNPDGNASVPASTHETNSEQNDLNSSDHTSNDEESSGSNSDPADHPTDHPSPQQEPSTDQPQSTPAESTPQQTPHPETEQTPDQQPQQEPQPESDSTAREPDTDSKLPAPPTPEPNTPAVVNEYSLQPTGTIYKISGTNHLVEYPTLNNSERRKAIDTKVYQFKEMLERHPDLKMYAYYVTKAQDLDWFDKSEGIQSFDYIQYLADQLPETIRFDYLKFDTLDDYKRMAYKTDHHWSHEGSYQGYQDMLAMMSKDFDLSPVKESVKELDFGGLEFTGSLVGSAGNDAEPDMFKAYEFDLGSYRSFINDEEGDFHKYDEYANGQYGRIDRHFMDYHGNLEGSNLIRHEFPNNEHNLLMISDSNNRPIRRVLASHFNTTYFVEYRMLHKVDLDEIIETYDIDAVLIFGQDRYWTDGAYAFEKNYKRP